MTRKDLEGKTYEEVSGLFDQELNAYVEEINKIESIDELTAKENELMPQMDETKKYIDTVEYDLPEAVTFDGERLTKNDIARLIVYFLNKLEVEWSATLGCWELSKMWRNKDFTKISYGAFDSTLRSLNTVKFKGFNEWRNILAVNEYMRQNHDEYTKDTALILLDHKKHEAILDRMQQLQALDKELNGVEPGYEPEE